MHKQLAKNTFFMNQPVFSLIMSYINDVSIENEFIY